MFFGRCLSVFLFVLHAYAFPVVQLNDTTVIGRTISLLDILEQEFYGGIPFAKADRFSPPIILTNLGVAEFNAQNYGPSCPQVGAVNNISEDCLSINVLRPAFTNLHSDLHVMVWLYGGGFLQGETFGTNASALVAESVIRGTPVIYVNFNYRVGPFGFPQGAEAEAQGALNLGIKDQVVALQWIKSNIAAFGGDPEKITVFGQSAGSISIALLYLNSGLENIVKSAIMESGFQSTVPMFNASMREPAWASFVNATPECSGTGESDTFSCLRRANLSTLVDSFNSVITSGLQSFPFAPVIDGPGGLIPALPSDLLAQGKFARVPFITGTVLDEGTAFISPTTNITGATELLEFFAILDRPDATQLDPSFIATADEIFILYPDDPALGSPFGTGNDTFGLDPEYKRICAITGDLAFQSLRRAWIEVATAVSVPAFGYIFTDPESVVASEPWLGVSHAYEVPYVYGAPILNGTVSSKALSLRMMNYWISFATSLNPNDGRGLIPRLHWPQYNNSNPVILQFGNNVTAINDDYRAAQIAYINSVPEVLAH